jgi:hypothetical protein
MRASTVRHFVSMMVPNWKMMFDPYPPAWFFVASIWSPKKLAPENSLLNRQIGVDADAPQP